MQKRGWLPIKIISLLAFLLLMFPHPASAYYTNMPASVVVGQPDFVSNSANQGGGVGPNTLYSPRSIAFCNGKFIVADKNNNRVLIFNSLPTSNNQSADVVIGQPDLISNSANQGGTTNANTLNEPNGLLCIGEKLLIADRRNHRILIFNSIPTTNNVSADVVIGQTDFTSNSRGCSATKLYPHNETHMAWTGEKLIVADSAHARILIFNSLPSSNGAAADVVIGQPDFTSCYGNQGGSPAANTLNGDLRGVYYYNGKLYVADFNNNRVLIWNNLPTTNNSSADVVWGQPDFTSNLPNRGGNPGQNTLYSPRHFLVSDGEFYLSEWSNNRVLIFNKVLENNSDLPEAVLGQPDFNSNSGLTTATGLYSPGQMVEVNNKLILLDTGNNRILIFENYESLTSPGLSLNYPSQESNEGRMKLSGNAVLGERGRFNIRKLEININNQGFVTPTYLTSRQHSDTQTIYEFEHEFEPWSGVLPRDQWSQGDGFSAHIRATSYQSAVEKEEAFIFWPFTLENVDTSGEAPTFSFSIPSKNLDYIKSNLDHFEVRIGKEGSFSQYLSKVPTDLIGEDGKVIVSANTAGVQTASASFTAGEYQAKVTAVDKWGYSFDSNALSFTLDQALVSAESAAADQGVWFPLQVNRITGVNAGILSSFRPQSVGASYTTTTLSPTMTGIAFAGSLVSVKVVNNQNPEETKTFTAIAAPDSTWTVTPALYPDSTVILTAQKGGLSTSLPSLVIRFAAGDL